MISNLFAFPPFYSNSSKGIAMADHVHFLALSGHDEFLMFKDSVFLYMIDLSRLEKGKS